MEPLTALGLAASVAQFIDFGSKLVGKTREIAKAGSSVSIAHLSTLTSDLIDINDSLDSKVSLVKAQNLMLAKEEQALKDLVVQCNDIAQELVRSLHSLTVDESQRNNIFRSVRAALETILKKERVDDLARRLSDFREQLTLRVLLLLNAHSTSQDSKLDASKHEIVEVVSLNSEALQSAIKGRYQREKNWHRDEHTRAEERHIETIAAILTTREGHSRTITGLRCGPHSSSALSPEASQTATTYRQAEYQDNSYSANSRQTADFGIVGSEGVTKRILDALHFRSIDERRATISKAYRRTFQWIYQDRISQKRFWDDLPNWLATGRGCYWISGKAGSGKSTLMKYILGNTKTADALQKWSGSSELVVASFFFWYAGTPLQKSQAGLLRSLLLSVLNRRPDLVPVLFPDLYRSIISNKVLKNIDFTHNELRSAFMTLCSSIPEGLKICFIIDGIDEYEGDHHEISELFSHVAQFESIKILLSSRPIPACVQAFLKFPKLLLQDLTRDDIKHYVEDKLGQDNLMQRLNQVQGGATSQLVESLTSKACGVFLWVILVVKRLLSGLRDYDTLSDLFEKLDELPGDLEALYDHMLGDMSAQNRRQGSKLLQLVLRSSETHGDIPMTVLQFSFAEEDEYSTSRLHGYSEISSDEVEWRCEAIEGRMRSRCCGLIEVQSPPAPLKDYKAKKLVGFLHRTVVDFLRSRTVWPYLISLTAETELDVNRALLNSTISEMTVRSQPIHTHAVYSLLRFLNYERNMENLRQTFTSTYIPALKTTIARVWHDKDLFDSHDTQYEAVTAATDRTCARYDLEQSESLVLFVATQCPRESLKVLLDGLYPADNKARLRQAAYLFTQFMEETNVPVRILASHRIPTCAKEGLNTRIEEFLPRGLLCDQRWLGYAHTGTFTIPGLAVNYAYRLIRLSGEEFFQTQLPSCFLDLWISMLEAEVRADLFAVVEMDDWLGRSFEYEGITALGAVKTLMSKIWAGVWDVQALLNDRPCRAPLPDSGTSFVDAVAAKCCRIDELSVFPTCGTDTSSTEIDPSLIKDLKRPLDHSDTTEAKKRPRVDTYDPCSEDEAFELSPWTRHCLFPTARAVSKVDEGREG